MFDKFISTLRGLMYDTADSVADRNDMSLLSQQLRDAGNAVRSARMAVALASAQQEQDKNRIVRIDDAVADLEERTRDALLKGAEDLAREGAEAISVLEDEQEALKRSTREFEAEIDTLKHNVRLAEARLREMERSQKMAVVRDRVRSTGSFHVLSNPAPLAEAEETLNRIQSRQERGALADKALTAMSAVDRPEELVSRLADAGCGAPVRSSADLVLERLRESSPKLVTQS